MGLKKSILFLSVLIVGAAVAIYGFETYGAEQEKTKAPSTAQQTTPQKQVAPDEGTEETVEEQAGAPENKILRLTVPKMERVKNAKIPTGRGSDNLLFKENTAVHVSGTGYPWEEEANVYIAGHRLGYPGTDSYLAFNDIDVLQNGDKIILKDAKGRKYIYEVFKTVVVEPTNLSVLDKVEGKNIVSLQSCTLPDYSDRIIVQARLKDKQS